VSDLASRFVGAMVGSALGDAIGERAFFVFRDVKSARPPELEREIERLRKLGYTDDTAMSLAVASSIAECGRVDPERLGARLAAEHAAEPWRGYASGPPLIFERVAREGIGYVEAARQLVGGQGSLGNGAAMRAAPVGLFFHDAPELYGHAERSAIVTHSHPEGIDGAAIVARAVAKALQRDPNEPLDVLAFARDLEAFARTDTLKTRLRDVGALLAAGARRAEAAERLGRGVTAARSVPYAIYAFLSEPSSFERCLFTAVLEDGDRDTVGAMACAIAGAHLGERALPPSWRAKLEGLERIETTAKALAEARARPG
jgi:poly(ADP-ribose) glycohydrolase ARH3